MAWTAADLTVVEAAIASGTLRVKFADREVEYRSISELLKARDVIIGAIDAAAGNSAVRSTYASFSKG